MNFLAALATCAPLVSPGLLSAIVDVESGGDPLAIYRRDTGESLHPQSEREAAAIARRLLAQGVRIDGGLAQIDSDKWSALGLSADNAFVACANLAAAEELLIDAYRQDPGDLDAALSRFAADGNPAKGIANGYVAQVRAAAERAPPGEGTRPPEARAQAPPPPGGEFAAMPDGFARER